MELAAQAIRDGAALGRLAAGSGNRIASFSLSTSICFATPESRAAFAQELTVAIAAIVAKYHDEQAPQAKWCRLIAGCYPRVAGS